VTVWNQCAARQSNEQTTQHQEELRSDPTTRSETGLIGAD